MLVSVAPSSATLPPSGTQQFTATVGNSTDTTVSWSVDTTPGSSSVGFITGTGNAVTYTAPPITGSHTVTATSMADTSKSASAAVTVGTTPAAFSTSNHVFVVIEENQSFAQVFPSAMATNCCTPSFTCSAERIT